MASIRRRQCANYLARVALVRWKAGVTSAAMSASVWDASIMSDAMSSHDMLNDEELLRYSRQILLQQIDIAGQLRLKNSRVLIIGLGGLGSPVALYLAAAGVGELHLADFDTVDLTNLQRQIAHDTASIGLSKVDSASKR